MEKMEAFKVKSSSLNGIRKLKKKDGRPITWHIERAIENYLKAKKVPQ